jgi:hypothetical protein
MRIALVLISLFWACTLVAQKNTFQLPKIDYDKVEESEGTKTYTKNGKIVLEAHQPYKGVIKYYCNRSNAVYDSVHVYHGNNMMEVRFKNGGNNAGYHLKKWSDGSNLVIFERYFKNKSLQYRYQGIAQNKVYNKQSPACSDDFVRTGVDVKYDKEGKVISFVNYKKGKAKFAEDNSSKKGKKQLQELKKSADKLVQNAYGKTFFKKHIKFNPSKSTGYYPDSRAIRKNKGLPNLNFGLYNWFKPKSDTITYADISYTVFLDENNIGNFITIRLDKNGNMVDAVDQNYARKWNMTRGLIQGSPDQTFLPPAKAIAYAKQNGLYLEGEDYLIDPYWEPLKKSGYMGKFYYRIRCNKHVKQLLGGRLYIFDEWLIDPFTKEIIKDKEYRDGVFMELDYPRKSKKNGLYGFNNSFYDADKGPKIPFEYQELPYEIQYRMIAKKNGKYGLISHKNEIIIPFEYDRMKYVPFSQRRFKNEFIQVQQNGQWGMLDMEGNEILPVKYTALRKQGENAISGYIGETEKVNYNFRTKQAVDK